MGAPPHYREALVRHTIGAVMGVADVPLDLVEVKLAAPLTRPGTVAKADVIARLCTSRAAACERGRARRVWQDDAACAVGGG